MDGNNVYEGGDPERIVRRTGPAKWIGLITLILYLTAFAFYGIFGAYLWGWGVDDQPVGLGYAFFIAFLWVEIGFIFCCSFMYGRGDAVWSYKLFNWSGLAISGLAFIVAFFVNLLISVPFVYNCSTDSGSLSPVEDLICENESWYFIALQIGSYVIGALLPILSIVSHFLMIIDADAPAAISKFLPFTMKSDYKPVGGSGRVDVKSGFSVGE